MSQLTGQVTSTDRAFRIEGREAIDFDLRIVDGVFSPSSTDLAEVYAPLGRCLMVVDAEVAALYGERARSYFAAHDIDLTLFPIQIAETAKSLATVQRIVDVFDDFGLLRTEPVLVVGGGLTTDVAGFACSTYRRGTPYVRIPTTLIGLIDASVSIKVAVNHGKSKNRLGAYHASQLVLLDFGFLRTLPTAQVRNGMAELVKIAVVGDRLVYDLLVEHGPELLETRFHTLGGTGRQRRIADRLTRSAIRTMLELESPNLHELDLDRVIAFGHTWSPTLELVPDPPMLHGHAISTDMALSTVLAEMRGHIDVATRDEVLGLISALGLSLDHSQLTPALLREATTAITKTRDGVLRAAVPAPVGSCTFLNDVEPDELDAALVSLRRLCADLPRQGHGVDVSSRAPEPALV